MGGFDEQTQAGAPKRPAPQRLSAIFARLAEESDGQVTLAHVRNALGDRSFATLLIFFAMINLLPLPPGATAVLGLPLVIVAAQMVYGSETVWLPRRVLQSSLTAEQFQGVMNRVVPWLVWLERYIRPRYWPFWPKQGERIIGGVSLLLAVIVTLPIPFGNWLPAFAITLLGFALFEKDGVLLGIGVATGAASVAVVALVVGSSAALIGYVWGHAGHWFSNY